MNSWTFQVWHVSTFYHLSRKLSRDSQSFNNTVTPWGTLLVTCITLCFSQPSLWITTSPLGSIVHLSCDSHLGRLCCQSSALSHQWCACTRERKQGNQRAVLWFPKQLTNVLFQVYNCWKFPLTTCMTAGNACQRKRSFSVDRFLNTCCWPALS